MANTPSRSAGRIPGYEWDPFVARAQLKGETTTDVIRRAIRQYVGTNGTFKAWVSREGKWWMIRIPELDDAITQARNESEIELMAKDLIAITLDIPVWTVKVELVEGIPE